ncbi:MAG TPA: sensor histidine kinase [Ktedonobacterales bacterium]|nr:sensor histidine kinase [Ktedonobacterales bacterium]
MNVREKTARTSWQSNTSEQAPPNWGQLAWLVALPLAIIVLALLWAIAGPRISPPNTPPQALLVLTLITAATALLVRQLRIRNDLDAQATLALPDPLYTLYLAAIILAGAPAAIVLAVATPLVASAPELFRAPQRLGETLRQSAAAAATTFAASLAYIGISAALGPHIGTLHAHLFAALVASGVMFAGAGIFRVLEHSAVSGNLAAAWNTYLASPALRFQFMMLALGPLLPLAELLDDIEAELAWMLFLVPLYAMYYLALLSMRLQQRTDELQRTVEELRVSRRREAELTGYAALITQAQEEERRRLARELHDDTAQALIALSRGLDTLASRRGGAPPVEDTRFLDELGLLAKRSLESIRRACQDLRPSVLDDLGLSAALESLASSMTQRGLPCTYTLRGEEGFCPPEIEVTVYRIAQEAFTNALRHARATETTMDLAYSAEVLRLCIHDNGCGFDPEDMSRAARAPVRPDVPEPRSGLGLLGMRERAALIGATLDITSAREHGTTVALAVPLGEP